jgi:hypothetical protein
MQLALKRSTLLAIGFVIITGAIARAETLDVTVPFPFVVHGQHFAAGEYRVQRNEVDSSVVAIRGEQGNTSTVLVLTTPESGRDPAGNKAAMTFKRYENEYWLSDIWEAGGQGRAVPVGR